MFLESGIERVIHILFPVFRIARSSYPIVIRNVTISRGCASPACFSLRTYQRGVRTFRQAVLSITKELMRASMQLANAERGLRSAEFAIRKLMRAAMQPAEHFKYFGRLAGAEDPNAEDLPAHPQGQQGGSDQQHERPDQVEQRRFGRGAVHHRERSI